MKIGFCTIVIMSCGFALTFSCQTILNFEAVNDNHSQEHNGSRMHETLIVELDVVDSTKVRGSDAEAIFLQAIPSSLPSLVLGFFWNDLVVIQGNVEEIPAIAPSGDNINSSNNLMKSGNDLRAYLTVLEIDDKSAATVSLGQWYSRKLYMQDDSIVAFQVSILYKDIAQRTRVLEFLPRVIVSNRKGLISISTAIP